MARGRKRGSDGAGRVVGYCRVSTSEQAESGLGLEAQKAAIMAEAARRGWEVLEMVEDAGVSGKTLKRPGIAHALEMLERGEAGGIVVAKLDRLSRSLADFANVAAVAQSQGWNLVALDLGIDLSTPSGEFLASVMASAAQWERRIIGQRTKDALAVARASGVKLGRPVDLPVEVRERVRRMRREGMSYPKIADVLNDEGVATARGGAKWYPSTVRAVELADA